MSDTARNEECDATILVSVMLNLFQYLQLFLLIFLLFLRRQESMFLYFLTHFPMLFSELPIIEPILRAISDE